MAAEAIERIKRAEEQTLAKIAEAMEKAKQINKAAQREGTDKRQAMLADAKRQRDEILTQANEEADKECIPLTQESQVEIEKINNPGTDKLNEAVNIVVERIVKPIDR